MVAVARAFRWGADAGADKSAAAKTADEVRDGKVPVGAGSRCGFITPRMWKLIIGRGHPEFCTNEQQDAAQFIAWMWDQLDKAHNSRAAQERVIPLADGSHSPSCFTGLQMQHRLLDTQSGGVRYTTTREWGMRIPIPTAAATNTAEVAAAKARVAEAVAKALADAADTVGGAVDAAAIVSDVMGPRPAKRARIDPADSAAVAARRIADRVHAELAPSIPKVRAPTAKHGDARREGGGGGRLGWGAWQPLAVSEGLGAPVPLLLPRQCRRLPLPPTSPCRSWWCRSKRAWRTGWRR
jgi:hypothetical protein